MYLSQGLDLHVLQLAVEEFETLIQGGGDDRQALISGPGLKHC
jgi:hypothetical protein